MKIRELPGYRWLGASLKIAFCQHRVTFCRRVGFNEEGAALTELGPINHGAGCADGENEFLNTLILGEGGDSFESPPSPKNESKFGFIAVQF